MPQNITQFRVFISSPDDLSTESQIISRCLDTLNQEFARRLISFRPIHWRTDVTPGLGADPQDVINSQIDYDIYVGLLGTYFGSPTPRAGSGTEEEYRRAVESYVAKPSSVRVLFYFKNSSLNVLRLNLDQLKKVQEFRADTSQQGLLSSEFASDDDLARLFTDHMRNLVEAQWNGNTWTNTGVSSTQNILSGSYPTQDVERDGPAITTDPAEADRQEDEEQDGVWDLVVTVTEASELVGSTLQQLSAASLIFTTQLTRDTEQLSETSSARQKRDPIDALAASIASYSDALNHGNPVFTAGTMTCLRGMERL